MISLYLLSYKSLILLLIILLLSIILQTSRFAYGFVTFKYHKDEIINHLYDLAILFQIIILEYFVGNTLFMLESSTAYARHYNILMYIQFIVILVLNFAVYKKDIKTDLFEVPLMAILTLPFVEKITGKYFRYIFIVRVCFWFVYVAIEFYKSIKKSHEDLWAFSVKEAVDSIDFGLLIYSDVKNSYGQILLCNKTMSDLMLDLTGKYFYNGKDFLDKILNNDVSENYKRIENMGEISYETEKGEAWGFSFSSMEIHNKKCILLTASNITKLIKATDILIEENEKLSIKNEELKQMLLNVNEICKTEETIRAKSQVHDLLGQNISRILRSVRENKEPDEELLKYFANDIMNEIKNTESQMSYSLQNLAKNFMSLGVKININGKMPEDRDLQKLFYEISAESITNAIRHGYATEISVGIEKIDNMWQISITDNGISKENKIIEGGGIINMRRKVNEFNGEFSYELKPHFIVKAIVPKGAES